VARSLYLRYLQAHGRKVEDSQFQGLYPGEYLVELAESLKEKVGDKYVDQPESVWLDPLRDFAIPAIMDMIRSDLDALGVHMDIYTSEKELTQKGGVHVALKTLQKKGDVYQGVLEKPKGHDADDWEERPQTLFRATLYGDDVDRPLQKSDGSWTYFAGDIAYHYDKYRRGFKKMIDILGADHVGYVKRIQAATKAITNGEGNVEVKTCQLVNIV
jgi:arginyl-tRNA synthetase